MGLETVWYIILAGMLAAYAVLDGFDLGVGAVSLWVARDGGERHAVVRSVGPVWDGNEVWLVAAGGTLYFAFPAVYASAFSGFYLPLMMVLWLLVFRAFSIEFRHHVEHPLWKPFWDKAFCLSSAALAVFLGAAMGNVVRGAALDAQGGFFNALFTNFSPFGSDLGILDWYTLLAGLAALAVLAVQGALWLNLKTEGAVQARSATLARRLGWPALLLVALLTLATWFVQPHVRERLLSHPAGALLPLAAFACAAFGLLSLRQGRELAAFLGWCLFIGLVFFSAAFGLYPYLLPSVTPGLGLTAQNSHTSQYGMQVGLAWFIPGMLLALAYFTVLYTRLPAKFAAGGGHAEPEPAFPPAWESRGRESRGERGPSR